MLAYSPVMEDIAERRTRGTCFHFRNLYIHRTHIYSIMFVTQHRFFMLFWDFMCSVLLPRRHLALCVPLSSSLPLFLFHSPSICPDSDRRPRIALEARWQRLQLSLPFDLNETIKPAHIRSHPLARIGIRMRRRNKKKRETRPHRTIQDSPLYPRRRFYFHFFFLQQFFEWRNESGYAVRVA